MKINELLKDDELYEIWWLLSDAIWEALVNKYATNEVDKGLVHKRQGARKPVKPFPIRDNLQPLQKASTPLSQTSGLNPKIDIQKGPDFKLKDKNIFPELSDKDIEIEMKKKPNGRH